jgi:hypothetical protein
MDAIGDVLRRLMERGMQPCHGMLGVHVPSIGKQRADAQVDDLQVVPVKEVPKLPTGRHYSLVVAGIVLHIDDEQGSASRVDHQLR